MALKVQALILAGGSGEGMGVLATLRTVPAMPFGGQYRVIDFTLSNCVNSGIYQVAVLTQYLPHSLHQHLGIGRPWDLDRASGGLRLLPAYVDRVGAGWYQGTADAIYQNLDYLEAYGADLILVLAADHVYKMDYSPLLAFHQEKEADLTVASRTVNLSEAARFGMMAVDGESRITRFEEKPASPFSCLASMGIYVFNRIALVRSLLEATTIAARRDFGRDVIPRMLGRERVYAFPFQGYWQDVGVISAYWSANMDLLEENPSLDLKDPGWPIRTADDPRSPARMGASARITHSLVCAGCEVRGQVEHSILSPGVRVEPGAIVRDSIVFADTVVGAKATVCRAIIDKEVLVSEGASVGRARDEESPEGPTAIVGKGVVVGPGQAVQGFLPQAAR